MGVSSKPSPAKTPPSLDTMVGRGCVEPKGLSESAAGIYQAKREEQSEERRLEGEVDAYARLKHPAALPNNVPWSLWWWVVEGWEGVLGLGVVSLRGISSWERGGRRREMMRKRAR